MDFELVLMGFCWAFNRTNLLGRLLDTPNLNVAHSNLKVALTCRNPFKTKKHLKPSKNKLIEPLNLKSQNFTET